jgi:hypothetical protein
VFVTVELAKFTKQLTEILTDLDKLIYTMKNLHTVTEISQFPIFWDEDWLKKAISEVDLRAMTSEQKLAYEMAISANALAVKNEKKKIQAREEKFVQNLIAKNKFSLEEIADLADVSIEFAKNVQNKLSTK